jgi:hypothetical protein
VDFGSLGRAIAGDQQARAQAKAAEAEADIFADVAEQQTSLAQSFLDNGEALTEAESATVDVFNAADDYERQEAQANPNVRSALDKLERIRQAKNQAKSPEQLERYYLQAADINKRILNDHPQYASVVLKASQAALGFDPLEKAVGLEQAQAVKQADFERAQGEAYVKKAVDAGVVDIGPDGTYDQESAKLKGQALAQQEYMLKQSKDRADALSAARVPESELKRQKFSSYMGSANAAFQTDIATFGANFMQLNPQLKDDPQSAAKIQEAWGLKRSVFLANQENYISQIDDPDVQNDVRAALQARLKPFDDVFTGTFSQVEVMSRQLDQLNKQADIDLATSAPMVARTNRLGNAVAEAVINKAIQTDADLSRQFTDQTLAYFQTGQAQGPQQEMQTFLDFAEGTVPLASMSDGQAKSAIKLATAGLNRLAETPNDISDTELNTYADMSLQIAAVGVNKNLPANQVASAAKTVSAPGQLRLFERYASDPNANPEKVQMLGEAISALNLKNINAQVQVLREMEIAEIRGPNEQVIRPAQKITPIYNAMTARFEVEGTITPQVQKQVDSINQSLQAIATVRDQVGGRQAELNEGQLKQYIVDTAGFPTTGPRIELPEWLSAPQAATPEAPVTQTPAEMTDELIRLAQAGDRAGIERILAGGQGATRPSQPLTGDLDAKIDATASSVGVDAELLRRLVRQESAGDPAAVSSTGARGLTQLMPETARDLGVDPDNPDQNLAGGARYLRQQLDAYNGDVRKALAAYNWGPGNLNKAIEKYGDQWDQHLPAETEDYIKKVAG